MSSRRSASSFASVIRSKIFSASSLRPRITSHLGEYGKNGAATVRNSAMQVEIANGSLQDSDDCILTEP